MDREAWHAAVHDVAMSRHDWATQLNWTIILNIPFCPLPNWRFNGLLSLSVNWKNNNEKYLQSAYYVSGTALSFNYIDLLNPHSNLWGRYF